MSDVDSLRRTKVSVSVNNVDITEDIQDHFLSLSFTDNEDGESDDLEIKLADRDNEIVTGWLDTEITKRGKKNTSCPYAEPSKTLKSGSSGTGVKWLQWYLNKVSGAGLTINGKFSTAVKNAVKKYQKKKGLTQSGTVNSALRSKLKSDYNNKNSNMTITATITQKNWNSDGKDVKLSCGTFECDEVSMSGAPQTVTLRGTSLSYSSNARKVKKTRYWESITLLGIAKSIAKKCGYDVMYLTQKSVSYTRKYQNNLTYIKFLQKLCTAAGLSLKVRDSTLIIFDKQEYESKTETRKIKRGDGSYGSYTMTAKLADLEYYSCKVTYTTSAGKKIEYTYTPSCYKYNKDKVLTVSNEAVSTKAEAKQLAIARLREANKGEKEISFTMAGDVTLCAGLTVKVSGWGAFDGKYIIETAKHTVSKSAGYQTTIKLRESVTSY